VLGQTLTLDGTAYRVIGVMPKEFGYPHANELPAGGGFDRTELWVPSALTAKDRAFRELADGNTLARLRPGVSVAEAQAEMSTIVPQFVPLHEPFMRDMVGLVRSFRDEALGPVRPLMELLLGAVGFVLLIACGNAANLLMARAAGRAQELSVRAALGARKERLLRQMLAEALLLSAAAGVAGVGLGYVFLRVLLRLDPEDIPRMQAASLDVRVMGFAVALTLLTTVLFGLIPAFSATRVDAMVVLKGSGTRGVVGERRRIRSWLAIGQVALVVVLLTGAGLFLRSYAKVLAVPAGFSASTVSMSVELTRQYDSEAKMTAFWGSLVERMKAVGGVRAVGVIDNLPLSNSESMTAFEVEGYPNVKGQLAENRAITPDYFSAMRIPLLQGRLLNETDEVKGQPEVFVVNEAFAKKYLGGKDALAGRIRRADDVRSGPWMPIVGVVGDVRHMNLEAPAPAQMYSRFGPMTRAFVTVRSGLPEAAVEREMRAVVKELDPTLAAGQARAMSELVVRSRARRRFQTMLLAVFAGVAMVLALVGVYGLLAYSVRQRRGEIGIRMALGSTRGRVVGLVVREGVGLVAVGLGLGAAAALAGAKVLAGFLYGVGAVDPVTFAAVPVLLVGATLVACVVPGVRAAGVDPAEALRHE